ncbi:TetR/AcrR family transcriptional regulator [Nocardioides sp.]|uniref:TetR/AcrR family transcriptional regulator n=1 Tax=Nocardioides sp. TaxID=35761 RepID=UPI003517AA6F
MSSASDSGSLRDRLLRAAVDALDDLTPVLLLRAVGGREITRRAGASPATIHHHFGSIEGLADAVLARAYATSSSMGAGVALLVDQIRHSHLPLEAVFALHGAEFDRNTTDPHFRHRLGLWALGGEQGARAYRDFLHDMDAQILGDLEIMWAAWGRRLREPFEPRTFLPTKTALLNGMTQLHLVDPHPDHRMRFQRASTAADLLLTRIEGDRRTVDDRLAEIHSQSPPRAVPPTPGTAPAADDPTRARILSAAATLTATATTDGITLTRVAAQAGVSLSTLYRYFATREHLEAALFLEQARPLLQVRGTAAGSPEEELRRVLADVARAVVPRVPLAAAYLTSVLLAPSSPDPAEQDPVLARTRRLIAARGSTPALEGDPDGEDDVARLLLALTVRRALLQPATPPERVAERALQRCGFPTAPGHAVHPDRAGDP